MPTRFEQIYYQPDGMKRDDFGPGEFNKQVNDPMYRWGEGMAAPVIGKGAKGYDRLINYMPIIATRNRLLDNLDRSYASARQVGQPAGLMAQLAATGTGGAAMRSRIAENDYLADLLQRRQFQDALLGELGAQSAFGPAMAVHQTGLKLQLKQAKKANRKSKMGAWLTGALQATVPQQYQGLNNSLTTAVGG